MATLSVLQHLLVGLCQRLKLKEHVGEEGGEARGRGGRSWGCCQGKSLGAGTEQRSGGTPEPPALCVRGEKGKGFPRKGPGNQESVARQGRDKSQNESGPSLCRYGMF